MGMQFFPTGMEKNAKITSHLNENVCMTWGEAIWGVLNGVMVLYKVVVLVLIMFLIGEK